MVNDPEYIDCTDTDSMPDLGFLSLMHLAKFGDAAAIEELTRRKIEGNPTANSDSEGFDKNDNK